jgi:hypothetical protein
MRTVGAKRWTQAESDRLKELAGDLPLDMIVSYWKGEAAKHGWPQRSRGGIKRHLNDEGFSVLPTGTWIMQSGLASLGITHATLNDWFRTGALRSYQVGPHGKRYINRRNLVRLAKEQPWRFGGCSADALFEVLENRELAEQIAAEYPFRPNVRRRVRCVETGEVFSGAREAAKAVHVDVSTIKLSARTGRATMGRRWEWVRPEACCR